MSGRERNAKRVKVECSVCQMTFDSDYRKKHNEKYHGDMLLAHRHIRYKVVGAPENPFTFSQKSKTPAAVVTSDNPSPATPEAETSKPTPTTSEVNQVIEETSLKPVKESTGTSELDVGQDSSTDQDMTEKAVNDKVNQSPEEAPERESNVWLSSLGKYPTDPANFRNVCINADVRAEVVRHGPCQPEDEVFPKDESGRSFQPSWYKKHGVRRDWLVYSMKEDAMFCFCCWLFPNQSHKDYEKNWSEIGVRKYRKGTEKIVVHESTTLHCVSLAHWKSFESRLMKGQTIDAVLQEELVKEREKTLQILDRIFSATLFLALQGVPFRGHRFESQEDIMATFTNSGNYLQLLQLLATYDPVLASHLASSSKTKYTSPKIQNEIIESIATVVREKIIEEILAAKYYCIIIDTTPDISHVDQLAFSVRYVFDDKPVERFICFDEMQGSTAVDFRDKLLELLKKFGLNPKFIRGQDGCSVMSGVHGGLQALVRQISPSALYVHCMAHRLNLMLVKASTTSVPMKSFFGLLETLYAFFVASTRRVAQLHECQKKADKPTQMPKSLSETRWAARANAVQHVRDNFECYTRALEELKSKNQLDARGFSDANGLLNGMMKFDFIFLLYFWFDILVITKAATDKVQGPSLNIAVSCHLIKACIHQFQAMRNKDEHFEATYAKVQECCRLLDVAADFESRRIRRRRPRIDETAAGDDEPTFNAKEKFKIDVYNVVLDAIVTDLNTRFNDTTVGVLKALSCLAPAEFLGKDAPSQTCLDDLQTLCDFYGEDLSGNEDVKREYQNIHALLNAWEFDDNKTVPRDVEDLLAFLTKTKLTAQFENVTTLLRLALTLPVSSAHDERSFSCLKRLKTYLRSTMTEDRLSNLACIAINREHLSSIAVRDLQKPFLNAKTRRLFNK